MASATGKKENPKVVSQAEWLAARKELLKKEKEFSHLRDDLSRQRRKHVHAVWRLAFMQVLNIRRLRKQAPDPHRRHPIDLGKSPSDDQPLIIKWAIEKGGIVS